jgi:hypothetical protein
MFDRECERAKKLKELEEEKVLARVQMEVLFAELALADTALAYADTVGRETSSWGLKI